MSATTNDYVEQQVQTWTLAGSEPVSSSGAMRNYAATWSANGRGSSVVRSGAGAAFTWTTYVEGMSAPLTLFQRASDRALIVRVGHTALRAPGAMSLVGQFASQSGTSAAQTITMDIFEWQWPWIEAAPAARISGTAVFPVLTSIGEAQPPDAKGTANCTWDFARGKSSTTPTTSQDCSSVAGSLGQMFDELKTSASAGYDRLSKGTTDANLAGALTARKAQTLAGLEAEKKQATQAVTNACSTSASTAGGGSDSTGGQPAPMMPIPVTPVVTTLLTNPVVPTQPEPSGTSPPAATPPVTATPGGANRNRVPVVPPGASTSPAMPAASAIYLVTVTGLRSGTPTSDNLLQTDGKGDEIYAAAYVRRYDRNSGQAVETSLRQSQVYGDINGFSDRQKAGSRSALGGIQGGDSIPADASADRRTAAQESVFPLKLWQGTLTDGADALVISPSIWEYDGAPGALSTWLENQKQLDGTIFQAAKVQDQILNKRFSVVNQDNVQGISGMTTAAWVAALGFPGVLLNPLDRPIGLVGNDHNSTALPNTAIVLAREIIESALASPYPTVVGPAPGILVTVPKPGILVINFADQATGTVIRESKAFYSMILQVERL